MLSPSLRSPSFSSTTYDVAGPRESAFFAALQAGGAPSSLDVRTCDDPSNPPADASYCSPQNTQGLASNGASDTCNGSASKTSDTFLHLEQNSDKLAADVDAWSAMVSTAVTAAVP